MDDRSADWLHLLPPGSRFVPGNVPPPYVELLGDRLTPDGEGYLGWRIDGRAAPALSRYRWVILVNPRRLRASDLQAEGFSQTLEFSVLPSLDAARWYMPTAPAAVAARGLDLYAAHRGAARLKKKLVSLAARCGQAGRLGDRLIVARREKSALEVAAERAAGCPRVFLSISTGILKPHRKPTVQVMAEHGRIVSYAKIAASDAAKRMLRQEIECLDLLARRPSLSDTVPRLLGTFEDGANVGSLQSPGPPGAPPTTFGRPHQEFLRTLATATGRTVPFERSAMWRAITAAYQCLEPGLTRTWGARLSTAIQTLATTVGPTELRMGLAHRDFRPRNHRLHPDGRLFVLDWELAAPEMVPLHDLFHFEVESYALIERRSDPSALLDRVMQACRRWEPSIDDRIVRRCFLAHLVFRALTRLETSRHQCDGSNDRLLVAIAPLLEQHESWLWAGLAAQACA
ncbi:MAG: phosphotransferase [Chloroflexi bacterium]|nr:phosphotransferase [Chloroflexota bacterium]